MRRRQLLAGSATAMTAGCLSSDDDSRLGGVRVENFNSDPGTAYLRIRADDSLVYDDVVNVDPASDGMATEIVECTWDVNAAEAYVVAGRLLGGDWEELTLEGEHSCQWVSVQLENEVVHLSARNCEDYPQTPCELRDEDE